MPRPGGARLRDGRGFARHRHRAAYVLEYPEQGIHIYAGFRPCETTRNTFWQMQANGDTTSSFFVGVGRPDYVRAAPNRRIELDQRMWAKQIQDVCRE